MMIPSQAAPCRQSITPEERSDELFRSTLNTQAGHTLYSYWNWENVQHTLSEFRRTTAQVLH